MSHHVLQFILLPQVTKNKWTNRSQLHNIFFCKRETLWLLDMFLGSDSEQWCTLLAIVGQPVLLGEKSLLENEEKWDTGKMDFSSGKPSTRMRTGREQGNEKGLESAMRVKGRDKREGGEREREREREEGNLLQCSFRCNFCTPAKVSKDWEDSRLDEKFECVCLREDDGRRRREKNVGKRYTKCVKNEKLQRGKTIWHTGRVRMCGKKSGGKACGLIVTTLAGHHPPRLTTQVSPRELSLNPPYRCVGEWF